MQESLINSIERQRMIVIELEKLIETDRDLETYRE